MDRRNKSSLGMAAGLLAVPYSFLSGYIVGIVAPLAAIAAAVVGIRWATGKIPFLSHTWPAEGNEQHLSLKLMEPEQAKEAFNREKERIGGEWKKMQTEMEAVAKEAQEKAKKSMKKK